MNRATLALVVLLTLAEAPIAKNAGAESEARPSPFDTIYAVLESPRCMNCHPAGDAPLQGDVPRRHAMNVTRTSAESGLACTTCHGTTNAEVAHGPPGRPGWRMPAADVPLVFEGRSAHALCAQLKDPARNGKKSLADLEEHMARDPFVLWGWQPGPGRSAPPRTHDETMNAVHEWIAGGARCP